MLKEATEAGQGCSSAIIGCGCLLILLFGVVTILGIVVFTLGGM